MSQLETILDAVRFKTRLSNPQDPHDNVGVTGSNPVPRTI